MPGDRIARMRSSYTPLSDLRTVLVTGAGGFIGRHLINSFAGETLDLRALVRKENVAFDDARIDVIRGDVRDAAVIDEAMRGVDTLFHLAAMIPGPREDPSYDDINVGGTANLIEAARRHGTLKRVVFTSSFAIYESPLREEAEGQFHVAPRSAYGRSKLSAERLLLDAASQEGWHCVILRPPMVYGPGCGGTLIRMIRLVELGLFPPVPESSVRHAMIHVSDLVEAMRVAATHPAASSQAYDVTDGNPQSTRETHDRICMALGLPVPAISIDPAALRLAGIACDLIRRFTGRTLAFDSETCERLVGGTAVQFSNRIEDELGFRASTTLDASLPEIIAAFHTPHP